MVVKNLATKLKQFQVFLLLFRSKILKTHKYANGDFTNTVENGQIHTILMMIL